MCGHIWVDAMSFWSALKLKSHNSGSIWFQKRKQSWRTLASRLELGEGALRASQPYKSSTINHDSVRVCTFPSLCLPLLIAVATRGAYSNDKTQGSVACPVVRGSLGRFVHGILSYMGPSFTIPLRVDPAAEQLGPIFFGNSPANILVHDGVVDLEELRALRDEACDFDESGIDQFTQVLGLDGTDFPTFFVGMCMLFSSQATSTAIFTTIFRQVLIFASDRIAVKLGSTATLRNPRGLARVPSRLPSNLNESELLLAQCWSASNSRQMERELGKYVGACKRTFSTMATPNLSFAGPDATKVGSDMSLVVGVIMNGKAKKVAIAAPQAFGVERREA